MEPKAGTSTTGDVPEAKSAKPLVKTATYPPNDRSLTILGLLDSKRCEGEFCDVQLKLRPGKIVYAHKALLAACSPYFEGMFTSTFLEATSEVVDMSHATEHSDILENVINTFYGHSFEINEKNVGETLNLATMLLIDDLKIQCAKVMEGIVNIRNSADVLFMAISYDLKDLQERVVPMLKSRFHDYIMFQEELHELSAKPFEFLLNQIDTLFISRKVDYLNLLLKWFTFCETDERAKVFITALQQIRFNVTKPLYREIESDVNDILLHLEYVNSDISEELGQQLQESLGNLKPKNFISNIPHHVNKEPEITDTDKDTVNDSDMEDEPDHKHFIVPGARFPIHGPKREQEYTKKDEEIWAEAHKDMAKRDQHRIWAKEWPPDIFNKLGTHDDPNRPKKIMRESPPYIHKSRKFKVKSEAELLKESNLVNTVVVLAPSVDYLKRKMANKFGNGVADDIMDICVYVPGKKSWFKLGSLSAISIQKCFSSRRQRYMHRPFDNFERHNFDSDDDDEDIHMEAMVDMYEIPEMMMKRNMTSWHRRRLMEQSPSPAMMRRMMRDMDMDMDEDNIPPHIYMMMMNEAGKRRRFMGGRGELKTSLPSLFDPKWKMVYLEQNVYFYHQEFCESVFCYDLLHQKWSESQLSKIGGRHNRGSPEVVDGIDMIVMGQNLYAVLRFCLFDLHRDFWSRRDDKEKNTQEIKTFFKVFRMDNNKTGWDCIFKTHESHTYIQVEKPFEPEKHQRMHYMDYHDMIPYMRQPGSLKTVLFAEDDEKLNIFLLRRQCDRDTDNVEVFKFSHVDIVYLDLNELETLIDTPYNQEYRREPTPLVNDSMVILLNDELKGETKYNLVCPGPMKRMTEYGRGSPEKTSEFQNGLKFYPACPTIMTRNRDTMWIMRGKDDNTSEMIEVTVSCCYKTRRHIVNKTPHPPPPFRVFSLATTGKIDKTLLRTLNPPTKYLHV